MWKKVTLPLQGIFICFGFWILLWSFTIYDVQCLPARAVLVDADPVEVHGRAVYNPDRAFKSRVPEYFVHMPRTDYYDDQESLFADEDSFFMGPDDAVTGNKYSLPINENSAGPVSVHHGSFIPSTFFTVPRDESPSSTVHHNRNVVRRVQGSGINQRVNPVTESVFHEVTVTSDYRVKSDLESGDDDDSVHLIERKQRRSDISIEPHLRQNNFTDVNDSHILVPSDAVLQYQPHPVIPNNDTPKDSKSEQTISSSTTDAIPSSTEPSSLVPRNAVAPAADDIVNHKDSQDDILTEYKTEPAIDFIDPNTTTDRTIYYVENQTYSSTPSESTQNVSDVSPAVESTKTLKLSSGSVAAIVIGVLACVTLITSSVIYLLYRRYNGKCTGVAEGKFNSDNCGYLDDSLRSSVYLNNHIELPKENSEEMTSLDNDSFLNSLETMTIQNYWADNTKNTKV